MAEKRMFSKTIIDSDMFLDMPLSAQALYFHLNMRADDDGFVNSPRKIQRIIGSTEDDMKLLIIKNFIIPFESGIVVIKHWRLHNYIQNDRYKETIYKDEKSQLNLKNDKTYALQDECIHNVYKLEPQNRIDKNRVDKNRIFVPPTVEEVKAYCIERNNNVDPQRFVNFYEAKGWMVGKNKMKDWKAAVRTWERSSGQKKKASYNLDALDKIGLDIPEI